LSYTTKNNWGPGTNAVNPALAPGGGLFIQVPSPATVTFVGEVPQGTLTTPHILGYNITSSQVPQSGLLQADLGYTPTSGDAVYRYAAGSGYQPTISWTTKNQWQPSEPTMAVGEAFYLQSPSAGNWVRNFSVQ